MLNATLRIAWEYTPVLFPLLGTTVGSVPMLNTTLRITWEYIPILFPMLGTTEGEYSHI